MAVKTASELKLLFAAGKIPTAADYADLIDSLGESSSGSSIETFTSSSGMFSLSKSVGAIEVFVNKSNQDTTINVPTNNSSNTSCSIPQWGAVAFVKISDSFNYWTPIAFPIQQGGSNGDAGNS